MRKATKPAQNMHKIKYQHIECLLHGILGINHDQQQPKANQEVI